MQLEKDFLVEGFDRATHWRCSTCLHHVTLKWRLDSIFTRMFDLLMLLIKSSTMSVLLRNSSKTCTQFLVASARPILLEALRYFAAKFCRASYDILLGNMLRFTDILLEFCSALLRFVGTLPDAVASTRRSVYIRVRVVDL